MTQFPVNSNIVTTGHKLRGQTKQHMVIRAWNYRCRNWVYVVLSMVNTLSGLLLTKKLNDDLEKNRISDDLSNEDKRLDSLDNKFQDDIKWNQI